MNKWSFVASWGLQFKKWCGLGEEIKIPRGAMTIKRGSKKRIPREGKVMIRMRKEEVVMVWYVCETSRELEMKVVIWGI